MFESPSNNHPELSRPGSLDNPPPRPEYRLYKLAGGCIAGPAEVVVCADDHEAIEIAKQQMDGLAIEVWHRPRLVTRLEPR
jgi:hypothetical protein